MAGGRPAAAEEKSERQQRRGQTERTVTRRSRRRLMFIFGYLLFWSRGQFAGARRIIELNDLITASSFDAHAQSVNALTEELRCIRFSVHRADISHIWTQNKGAKTAVGTVAKHRRRSDETFLAGDFGAYIAATVETTTHRVDVNMRTGWETNEADHTAARHMPRLIKVVLAARHAPARSRATRREARPSTPIRRRACTTASPAYRRRAAELRR